MSDSVLDDLKQKAEDGENTQKELLARILKKNSDTVYGSRYGFSKVDSYMDYQSRVPLTDWKDYEDYISRMISGESKVLTSDDVTYYCISSGASDQPKYIPLTSEDIELQGRYWIEGVGECINEYFRARGRSNTKPKIFNIGEYFLTEMENGTMSGVRAGAPYLFRENAGLTDYDLYTAPKEILFPGKLEDMLYMKLRFALEERSVTAIHAIYVHKIVGLFDYLCRNWEFFIEDIMTGRVSPHFGISDEWKAYIEGRLKGNPARANELKNIPLGDGKGLAAKIWPELKYVCVAGGSIFASYMRSLRKYIGRTPIHHFVYATSESNLGISLNMNSDDADYVLIPDAAVFEFMPVDGSPERPLMAWEVEKDAEYELYVTTLSGLYRYSVQDIVKVVGFYGRMPVVSISYRKNQVMDLAKEHVTMRQIEEVADHLGICMGAGILGFCIDAGESSGTPDYTVYIETEMGRSNNDSKCSDIIDGFLKEHNKDYCHARETGALGIPRVVSLRRGAFRSYGAHLSDSGYRMEQNKPLHIISTEVQRDFFRRIASE